MAAHGLPVGAVSYMDGMSINGKLDPRFYGKCSICGEMLRREGPADAYHQHWGEPGSYYEADGTSRKGEPIGGYDKDGNTCARFDGPTLMACPFCGGVTRGVLEGLPGKQTCTTVTYDAPVCEHFAAHGGAMPFQDVLGIWADPLVEEAHRAMAARARGAL